MVEFTCHIQVTVLSFSSTTISNGGTYDFMADTVDFQPTPSYDDGGVAYNCNKTFVIDTPDEGTLRTFSIPRSCMVRLFGCDGREFVVGSAGIPARVLISRHLQRSQLQMTCKMLRNPLG